LSTINIAKMALVLPVSAAHSMLNTVAIAEVVRHDDQMLLHVARFDVRGVMSLPSSPAKRPPSRQ